MEVLKEKNDMMPPSGYEVIKQNAKIKRGYLVSCFGGPWVKADASIGSTPEKERVEACCPIEHWKRKTFRGYIHPKSIVSKDAYKNLIVRFGRSKKNPSDVPCRITVEYK